MGGSAGPSAPPISSRRRRDGSPAMRRPIARRRKVAAGAIGVVCTLAVWELAAGTGLVDPAFASSPRQIANRLIELASDGTLAPALLSTSRLFLTGFGIALAIGLTMGVIIGWFSYPRAILNPWVSMLYASPRIAFIPLIVVWAGAGFRAQTVIIVINAVFPILVSTMAGVAAVDRQLLRVAQSFGASNWDVLRTVALPGAIPVLVAGIRMGMMTALLGTVVAEYFVGLTGVGGMIFNAGLILDTSTAFVGAILFAIAAMILSSGLEFLQARVDKWR